MDNKDKSPASQSQAAQPSDSINTDAFRKLLLAYTEALFGLSEKDQGESFAALVTHIHAWHTTHLAGQSQATKVQAVPPSLADEQSAFDAWEPEPGWRNPRVIWAQAWKAAGDSYWKNGYSHGYTTGLADGRSEFVNRAAASPSDRAEKADPAAKVIVNDGNGTATIMLAPGADLKVGMSLYTAPTAQEVTQQAAKAETAEQAEGEQANVLPPTRGTDSQHDASDLVAQPKLYARLMEMSEILRDGGRWTGNEFAFADKSESDVSMLDDILGDALRLAAEPPVAQTRTAGAAKGGADNNDNGSDLAPTTSTATASGSAQPTNQEFDALWEQHGGHASDFAADILERWGGWPAGVLGQGGSAQASQAAASDTELLNFMIAEECQIEHFDKAAPTTLYRLRWPYLEEHQREWSASGREAIAAALRTNPATPASKPTSTDQD